MKTATHPTKAALIAATVDLLDTTPVGELQVDRVVHAAGASVSSLYHFFADFHELVETAQVARFARYVDQNIDDLTAVIEGSRTREELRIGLAKVTRATQAPKMRRVRMDRIQSIAATAGNERMAAGLGAEQRRLTSALAGLFVQVQERGWMSREFDPMAAAVLIQAYTLGVVVNDVSPERIDPERYYELIDALIDRVFGLAE